MSARELDAAGIHDPLLRTSYETCRRLNAEHGKSYYLATFLLPPHKRPHVHALYGFARYADDFVDSLTAPDPDRLVSWGDAFLRALQSGGSADPVAAAAAHTMGLYGIPVAHAEAFLQSMRQDITVSSYETYEDLRGYMYGSASVIGLQMVPVLGVVDDRAHAHAQLLGEAFQLTNFIRDVAEDLVRGRIYLPQEDLDRFGVGADDLRPGPVSVAVRDLVRFEVDRARGLYARAAPGIGLLDPTSRDCVRTAFHLYGGILDEVERAGYDVLNQRVTVSRPRRLRIAAPRLVAAARARRRVRPARPGGPTTSTSTSTT